MANPHWEYCKKHLAMTRSLMPGDEYKKAVNYLKKDPSFSHFLTSERAKFVMARFSHGIREARDPKNLSDPGNPLHQFPTGHPLSQMMGTEEDTGVSSGKKKHERSVQFIVDEVKKEKEEEMRRVDNLGVLTSRLLGQENEGETSREARRRATGIREIAIESLNKHVQESDQKYDEVMGELDSLEKVAEGEEPVTQIKRGDKRSYSRRVKDFDEMLSVLKEMHAVLSWEACGRRVLKPSQVLFDMLMNTDANVPVKHICAPFQVLFVEFPYLVSCVKHSDQEPIMLRGCYVSCCKETVETIKEDKKAAAMLGDMGASVEHGQATNGITVHTVACGDSDRTGDDSVTSFKASRWIESDENLTLDTISKMERFNGEPAGYKELREKGLNPIDQIMTAVANLFLYMSMPDTDRETVHGPLAEQRHKQAKPKRRKVLTALIEEQQEPVTYVLGSKIQVLFERAQQKESNSLPGSTGRERRPHWRRGHWRLQPHGPRNSLRRPKLIKPMMIRKDLLADDVEYEVGTYEVGPDG